MRFATLAVAAALVGLVPRAHAASRRPVLVELFSSEGCSSCPPADAVLAALDRDQDVEDAEVIPLELHVDYWNRLGWTDPFSSAAFSARQGAYARAMGRSGVYTPQAVVDGRDELVGSKGRELRARIAEAARRPAAQVALELREGRLQVKVDRIPPDAAPSADVWLAITERGLATSVPRGENAGRRLAHGPVVRELRRLGAIRDGAFSAAISASLPAAVKPESASFVVFVQESKSLHILGAAQISDR